MSSTEKPLNAWELDSTVGPSSRARCAPAASQSRPATVVVVPPTPTNLGGTPAGGTPAGRERRGGCGSGQPEAVYQRSRFGGVPERGSSDTGFRCDSRLTQ